jgi:hypothetical protein
VATDRSKKGLDPRGVSKTASAQLKPCPMVGQVLGILRTW